MPPYKEKEIKKLFYTIGEVSKILNVNVSLVRFWDNEFDIIKPKKNKKGNRLFSENDLKNLKIIHHLLKNNGFTIKGAKKVLKSKKNDFQKNIFLKERLLEFKKFLVSLRGSLWSLKYIFLEHISSSCTY